ncbi:MAG: archaeosortase/exosortase family protein [Candidatus Aenigmarchaeota archaeon]
MTSIQIGKSILFNVTVSDTTGASNVNATFVYPNGTKVNVTLSDSGDDFWTYTWNDTFRSGTYNVTQVWANDTLGNTNLDNYTNVSFNVEFGLTETEFVFPNFRILNNQTFNITVNITAVNGDLLEVNLTLNITEQDTLNLTIGETWSKPDLYNITNGTIVTVKWEAESKNEGFTRVYFNATPKNGTGFEDSTLHEVVLPEITISPSTINITGNMTLQTEVVGNVTFVKNVNFSLEKPYSGGIDYTGSSLVSVLNESDCAGVAAGAGENVALLISGGSGDCNVGTCNLSIDNNTDTAWIGDNNPSWLNISLNSSHTIDRIELVWEDAVGQVNASVSYKKSGAWIPLFTDVNPPDDKNLTEFSGFTPFRTNQIRINHSSSAALIVYELRLFAAEERTGLCYVYEFNYTNITLSGLNIVNTTVYTNESSVRNNASFNVNFGESSVSISVPETIINGTTKTYKTIVTAWNGDLRNLTINLTIENQTVLNLSSGENITKNISFVLNGNSDSVNWSVDANAIGVTNTTTYVNSSTREGGYNFSLQSIEVIFEDPIPPNVTNFWFNYSGVEVDKTNMFTALSIFVNATDDVSVEEAKANITYPDSTSINGTMEKISSDIWEFKFGSGNNPENLKLNQTGNYTIRITAIDIGTNEKKSGVDSGYPENLTFYVNSSYTLNLTTNHSVYNRGETLTIEVYDVNDNLVNDVNWTVNLTKYNQSEENVYNETNTSYTYSINTSDPSGNYTLFVNVSKNNNTGNSTWYFNASSTLLPVFTQPPSDTQYSTSSGISPIPQIRVYSIRNESLGYTVNVTLSCPNGNFSLGRIGNLYYNISADCRSSSSSGVTFYLTTNVMDTYNNTGTGSLSLRTQAASEPPPGSGGGGPIGNVTCVPTPKNCSDGLDNDCDGFVDCGDSDCAREHFCIIRVGDFNLTFESKTIEIVRGGNGTVIGSIANLGNIDLDLKSNFTRECCEVSIDKEFHLPVKGEIDFPVVIHVPLYTELGEYLLAVGIAIGSVEKTRNINIIVVENPSFTVLDEVKRELPELTSMVEEYAKAGVDVSALNEKIKGIENDISEFNNAIKEDDMKKLGSSLLVIKSRFSEIERILGRMLVQKLLLENKWNILGILLACFFTSFFLTQTVIPFYRLRKDIRKFGDEERITAKTEESTESQYFSRRIDKNTYLKIITKEHNRLLEINSMKETSIKRIQEILNPKYILGRLFVFPVLILRGLKGVMLSKKSNKIRQKKFYFPYFAIRFILLFLVAFYLLPWLFDTGMLQAVVRDESAFALNQLGFKVVYDEFSITVENGTPFVLNIQGDFSGLGSMIFYLALVLATLGITYRKRLLGLVFGLPLVHLFNLCRILGVVWVGNIYGKGMVAFFQEFLWDPSLLTFAGLIWVIWLIKIAKPKISLGLPEKPKGVGGKVKKIDVTGSLDDLESVDIIQRGVEEKTEQGRGKKEQEGEKREKRLELFEKSENVKDIQKQYDKWLKKTGGKEKVERLTEAEIEKRDKELKLLEEMENPKAMEEEFNEKAEHQEELLKRKNELMEKAEDEERIQKDYEKGIKRVKPIKFTKAEMKDSEKLSKILEEVENIEKSIKNAEEREKKANDRIAKLTEKLEDTKSIQNDYDKLREGEEKGEKSKNKNKKFS